MGFALTFALFIFPLAGLVDDLAVEYDALTVVHSAAYEAALRGASDISLSYFLSTGILKLNGNAVPDCQLVGDTQANETAYITSVSTHCVPIGNNEMQATITVHVSFPLPLLSSGTTMTEVASAFSQNGTTVPCTSPTPSKYC